MLDYLIIDDDERFRERLARALAERGAEVGQAANLESATEVLQCRKVKNVLLDLKMPGASGLDLLRERKLELAASRVVVLTGYGSIPTAVEAMRLGAYNYLTKPSSLEQIVQAFEEKPAQPGKLALPSLEEVEREYLQRVVADSEGNISRAARALGLHRRSLQRKLLKC